MNITLIANAGLLIDTGRVRLLADGLYSDTGHTFSAIPKDIEQRIMAGDGGFGRIQYLLFTHLHPDHFDRRKVNEFTERHSALRVCFPAPASDSMDIITKMFIAEQSDNGANPEPLTLKSGERKRIVTDGDTEITAVGTGHMGMQYADVRNICYLLKANGKTLLVTGDAGFDESDFAPALACGHLNAAVVNPLFLQSKQGAEIIRKLSVRQLILYHIPFEGEDPMNLRSMARRQMQRYKNEGFEIVPLLEPMQSIDII